MVQVGCTESCGPSGVCGIQALIGGSCGTEGVDQGHLPNAGSVRGFLENSEPVGGIASPSTEGIRHQRSLPMATFVWLVVLTTRRAWKLMGRQGDWWQAPVALKHETRAGHWTSRTQTRNTRHRARHWTLDQSHSNTKHAPQAAPSWGTGDALNSAQQRSDIPSHSLQSPHHQRISILSLTRSTAPTGIAQTASHRHGRFQPIAAAAAALPPIGDRGQVTISQ